MLSSFDSRGTTTGPPAQHQHTHWQPPVVNFTMTLLYPSSHEIARLNDTLLSIKIARHSSCSICSFCTGLHPLPGTTVGSDDTEASSSLLRDLTQYGSDDDDGSTTTYLLSCACGHSAVEHNADICDLDRDEFIRRGLVGIRLDELLQVSLCVVIRSGFLCSNQLYIHRYELSPPFDTGVSCLIMSSRTKANYWTSVMSMRTSPP